MKSPKNSLVDKELCQSLYLTESFPTAALNKNQRKSLGAFYTPKHVVDFILSKLTGLNKKSALLEPSGGDGAFVSRIIEKKLLRPDQITVWDINPSLRRKIQSTGVKKFISKDALLETDFENGLFSSVSKFSFIIGNPPYLNKQSQYIKKNKKKLGKIFSEIGANDTYAMFLYLGCKLLEKNGQLCFIISDTYLTLGIHRKLRKFLLENCTINEIVLCPKKLFKDTGALVNTSIIYLTNRKVGDKHEIVFNDCRENEVDNFQGKRYKTRQKNILNYPDYIFDFNGGAKLLEKMGKMKKMVDLLDGGLGMHTTDNSKFLAIVDYGGKEYASKNGIKQRILAQKVDGKKWKFYHKKGGNKKYYFPAEYAIKWDALSRKSYKMPKNYNTDIQRKGFIISGICSNLTARLSTPSALWESNKAMCFFPKNPKNYSPEFFVGILNSQIYGKIIRLLNHTNSFQIRDIKKLPFPDFQEKDVQRIAQISKDIIKKLKSGLDYNFNLDQEEIDNIVSGYFN